MATAAQADVYLSAGHGADTWEKGGGKGVRKNGIVYEEHTANADVVKRMVRILEAHGLKVYLPQKLMGNDRSLTSRIAEANRHKPKLYYDIHFNAGVSSARGACAFYWHSNDKTKKLAEQFAANAKAAGIPTHGNGTHASKIGSWTNFAVLRDTRVPALLTENGFMTNSQDFVGIFGKDKAAYRQKVAEVNAKTILGYFGIKYKGDVPDGPKYSTDPQDRKGEVVLKADMNYRREPSLSAPIIRVLPKGHGSDPKKPVHYYEIKGDWLRLGTGWVSNKDGKYVEITKRYVKPPQPAEPKQAVYRVIVDGAQVGAYKEGDNVLEQARKAMAAGKEDVKIEKV